MIGWLQGTVKSKTERGILLDVNGVGYEIQVPDNTLNATAQIGKQIEIHVHTHVREDSFTLFGFSELIERDLFRVLISISQIGPKLALSILSDLAPSNLIACIHAGDNKSLRKVHGIGEKTADRLLLELRDKVSQFSVDDYEIQDGVEGFTGNRTLQEAIDVLIAMGFTQAESRRSVHSVMDQADSTEQVVVQALAILRPSAI